MKSFKNLSVHVKVPIMMGLASFFVLSLVCMLLLFPLRSGSMADSSKIAQLTAVEAGNHLAERINGVANIVRTYSGIIEMLADSEIVPAYRKREWLIAEIEMTIRREPALHNLWCTLEPNALDGMDVFFAGREDMGSDMHGIFAPWFASGTMSISNVMEDYQEDYYIIPKETGREVITEPYWDPSNGEHMFSICAPIFHRGRFIGVVGSDFHTEELNKMIMRLNRNTFGKLVTSLGTIAVHSDQNQIGEQAEEGSVEIIDKLSDGKLFEGIFHFEGKDVYMVYAPINLGKGNKPWFYAVYVPIEDIFSRAGSIAFYLILFSMIGVVLIAIAGGILMRPILQNVTTVTETIRKLSQGNINLRMEEPENHDEIGVMKKELNRLTLGLKLSANFAKSIGDGNFEAEYSAHGKDDVLGNSLIDMRRSLQNAAKEQSTRAKEEEQRSWITAGLAKFSEILRTDNDNMENLSYNIISSLVKYLNINQGGIFLLSESENESQQVLEMKACYAFDRRKIAEGTILPGEGLVGACFLEGEAIYVTEVPDRYITITSGLGDANPNAILISPLKINDEIFGVVELASFSEFESYQIDFVQKLCESVAATLSAVRVNTRTKDLLDRTRLQTEEMQNQGEELRQNMEEMRATQEDMRRREGELKIVLANAQKTEKRFKKLIYWYEALFNSLAEVPVIVTDKAGRITFINKSGLHACGLSKEEAMGKLCSQVCNFEICNTERCSLKLLKQGINKSVSKIGENTYNSYISYVKGADGKTTGHIEIFTRLIRD